MKYCYYAIGLLVVAIIYFGLGSIDCEAPSLARFAVTPPAPVPDTDNICQAFKSVEAALSRAGSAGLPDLDRLPEEKVDRVLAANAEAVAAFLRASRLGAWRIDRQNPGAHMGSPGGFWFIDSLSNLSEIQGARQLERGETGAATETARDLLALGRKMAEGSESVDGWDFAWTVAGCGCRLAMRIAASGKAAPEELHTLRKALLEIGATARRDSLRRVLKSEIYAVYAICSKDWIVLRLHPWTITSRVTFGVESVFRPFWFHPNRTLKMYARRTDKALDLLERNYDDKAWFAAFGVADDGWKEKFARCPAVPNSMGRQSLHGLGAFWISCAREAANGDLLHASAEVAVAVELYRRANGGATPETLAALVPDFLPAVPKDPLRLHAELCYDASNGTVSSAEYNLTPYCGRGAP